MKLRKIMAIAITATLLMGLFVACGNTSADVDGVDFDALIRANNEENLNGFLDANGFNGNRTEATTAAEPDKTKAPKATKNEDGVYRLRPLEEGDELFSTTPSGGNTANVAANAGNNADNVGNNNVAGANDTNNAAPAAEAPANNPAPADPAPAAVDPPPPPPPPPPVNPSAGIHTNTSPGLIDQAGQAYQALVNAGFSVTNLEGGFAVKAGSDITIQADGNLFGFIQFGSGPDNYSYHETNLGRGSSQSITLFEGTFWLQKAPVQLGGITLGTASMTRIDSGGYGWIWRPSQPVTFTVPAHVASIDAYDGRDGTTRTFGPGQTAYIGLDGASIWFNVAA